MLVETCDPANLDSGTGICSAPYWAEVGGLFSGWSADQLRQVTFAVLGLLVVLYVIRLLHKWAETSA